MTEVTLFFLDFELLSLGAGLGWLVQDIFLITFFLLEK